MTENSADPIALFQAERRERIDGYRQDAEWKALSERWRDTAFAQNYVYNFDWLGRPIVQMPADMVAVQELIWSCKPDLIVETGIAHGGSLMLSASMLALLDIADAVTGGTTLDPRTPRRKVLGIDIDIRAHNKHEIENHPLFSWIEMIEGSSIADETTQAAAAVASGYERVMVFLDSNHTHEHVLAELEAYAPLVSPQCYCVVFDTVVEHLPAEMYPNRPWAPGDNPKTAVNAYLTLLDTEGRQDVSGADLMFEVDEKLDAKVALSSAPGGYLRRVE